MRLILRAWVEKQIAAFYAWELVKDPVDIFTLEDRDKASLTPLKNREGWGKKSAENLFAAIQKPEPCRLPALFIALASAMWVNQRLKCWRGIMAR